MSDLLRFLLIALFSSGTLAAALAMLVLLLPNFSVLTAQVLSSMPGRSFLLGLVNAIFLGIVAIVAWQIGQSLGGFFGGVFSLGGLSLFFLLGGLGVLGMTGVVWLLHQRAYGDAAAGLTTLLRISLLCLVALFSPLLGWLVLTPILFITSLGATLIALLQLLRLRSHNPTKAA
ncbi:MAG: hypothetical protein KA314_11770 [Chloroflexi bacterium]|nr:hypothetical protein [Chloroflexota bacterium]MBP8056511.1 hypothetical protein [Chloroflexota bacterium]